MRYYLKSPNIKCKADEAGATIHEIQQGADTLFILAHSSGEADEVEAGFKPEPPEAEPTLL